MKRIFVTITGTLFWASSAFAQGDAVSFESLVSFDGIFDEMKQVFIDVIKDGGVLFISLAVIVMLLKYLQAFMGDSSKFKEAEQLKEREARIAKQAQRIEDKREAALLERQRERERTGYVDDFEREYRSRELQSRIDNPLDKEIYTNSEGKKFEVIRRDDVVEYIPYQEDCYENKDSTLPSYQQDISGYWVPVFPSDDNDEDEDELTVEEKEDIKEWFRQFYTDFYIDDVGEPKERDKRTGINRDRISRNFDFDDEEYSGY